MGGVIRRVHPKIGVVAGLTLGGLIHRTLR